MFVEFSGVGIGLGICACTPQLLQFQNKQTREDNCHFKKINKIEVEGDLHKAE